MNNNDFLNWLSKVAEWEYPLIGLNGGPAKPNLRAKNGKKKNAVSNQRSIREHTIHDLSTEFDLSGDPFSDIGDSDCISEADDTSGTCEDFTGPNTTVSPQIVSLFPIKSICDDCNNMVTDRVVTYRRCGIESPRPYWKIKCTACRMHKNPWTGEFNIEPDQVGRVYQAYSKEEPGQKNRAGSILQALKSNSTK